MDFVVVLNNPYVCAFNLSLSRVSLFFMSFRAQNISHNIYDGLTFVNFMMSLLFSSFLRTHNNTPTKNFKINFSLSFSLLFHQNRRTQKKIKVFPSTFHHCTTTIYSTPRKEMKILRN